MILGKSIGNRPVRRINDDKESPGLGASLVYMQRIMSWFDWIRVEIVAERSSKQGDEGGMSAIRGKWA